MPPEETERTSSDESTAISEDWLATVVGLVLLGLVLSGVLTSDLVWVP